MGAWRRSFLAASVSYLIFCLGWAVTLRVFEPEIATDHGGPLPNLGADLVMGIGLALFGVLFMLGVIFWLGAALWGRLQLIILRRIGLAWWLPSAVMGLFVGIGAGYLFIIVMNWADRPWEGPMISSCIAGVVAGIVLMTPWEKSGPRRTVEA